MAFRKIFGLSALVVAFAAFCAPSIASAATTHQYVLANPKAKCHASYVKRTIRITKRERIKVHGHWTTKTVFVRRTVGCIYVPPKVDTSPIQGVAPVTSAPVSAPSAPAPTVTQTPVVAVTTPNPTTVRANIDPSYTQDPSNPLLVTFTYLAANSGGGSLPDGTLNFTVFVHAAVAQAGGCTMNVGGNVTGGTCTVTLPAFGQYDLNTTFSGGSNVSATAGTETVVIEPPPLAPETVIEHWGTTAPTNSAAASANVVGSSAAVTVTDANWEGATSATLTDNLSDTCQITVVGTSATCNMTVTGTPSAFTVDYPGGVNNVTTQTLSPWGIPQSQTVTYTWPAQTVVIAHPTVTSQTATVMWNGGWLKNGNTTQQVFSPGPPNPLVMTSGETLRLSAATFGSVINDPFPIGYLVVTVTGPGGFTEVNEGGFGSTDCSTLANYSSEAVGTCQFTFSGPGVYDVTYSYVSQDLEYAGGSSVTDVVNVVS